MDDVQRALAPMPVEVAPPAPPSRRSVAMGLSGVVAALALAVLAALPAHYSLEEAGPTFDVFADRTDGGTLLAVRGADTYDPSGELRLTTVLVSDASHTNFTMGAVLSAWFSPTRSTYPIIPVYQDAAGATQQQWISSQEIAIVAALGELGIEVPATIRLAEIMEESNATGKLEVDDVIVGANGVAVNSLDDLSGVLDAMTPGDPITLDVVRADRDVQVTFDTIDDGDGSALMGVWIDPTFEMPYDVDVAINNVGGPSAGLIFTLGIVDLLTPVDELHGANIAGTGTISPDGDVGPIGGIALKMIGARRDGADWFLAPGANCGEVVGAIPSGLRVVRVDTLGEAYDAIVAIGAGQADDLPTCEG